MSATLPHFLFSFQALCTGYYPTPDGFSSAENRMEGGNEDRRGKPLYTLQGHLDGDDPHISVAMDAQLLPYGTILCLPKFNLLYHKQLIFKVVDTGGAFKDRGFKRMDICCADKAASESDFLNAVHDVVALLQEKEAA